MGMVQTESWQETVMMYRVHCQHSDCEYDSQPTSDWALNEMRRKRHHDYHNKEANK